MAITAQQLTGVTTTGALSDRDLEMVTNLLSDPLSFPITFKTWLIAYLEANPPSLPSSSVIGSIYVPIGGSIDWWTATAPVGWLLCDGTSYKRTDYPNLFNVIGVTYGAADGTHFNVPDVRERVTIMKGNSGRISAASTGGGNANTLGGVGGGETYTLVTNEIPSHTHADNVYNTGTAPGVSFHAVKDYEATGGSTPITAGLASTGGGAAHSNTQPWIACNKIIRY